MEKVEQGRLNERFVGLEDKRPSEDSLAPCAMSMSMTIFLFADGTGNSQLRYRKIQVNMLNKAQEMADFVIMNQSSTITSQKYISGINCSLLL